MSSSILEVIRAVDLPTPPQDAYNYLCNPNSWLEWLGACEGIRAEDRPHAAGETFSETYRYGERLLTLDWRVVQSAPSRHWEGHTGSEFTGPVEIRYDFEETPHGCRFTRRITFTDLPNPLSNEQVAAVEKEADESLDKIKNILTRRT